MKVTYTREQQFTLSQLRQFIEFIENERGSSVIERIEAEPTASIVSMQGPLSQPNHVSITVEATGV